MPWREFRHFSRALEIFCERHVWQNVNLTACCALRGVVIVWAVIALSASARENKGRHWVRCLPPPGTFSQLWHMWTLTSLDMYSMQSSDKIISLIHADSDPFVLKLSTNVQVNVRDHMHLQNCSVSCFWWCTQMIQWPFCAWPTSARSSLRG